VSLIPLSDGRPGSGHLQHRKPDTACCLLDAIGASMPGWAAVPGSDRADGLKLRRRRHRVGPEDQGRLHAEGPTLGVLDLPSTRISLLRR
jgi:hypothetical protein